MQAVPSRDVARPIGCSSSTMRLRPFRGLAAALRSSRATLHRVYSWRSARRTSSDGRRPRPASRRRRVSTSGWACPSTCARRSLMAVRSSASWATRRARSLDTGPSARRATSTARRRGSRTFLDGASSSNGGLFDEVHFRAKYNSRTRRWKVVVSDEDNEFPRVSRARGSACA